MPSGTSERTVWFSHTIHLELIPYIGTDTDSHTTYTGTDTASHTVHPELILIHTPYIETDTDSHTIQPELILIHILEDYIIVT